MPVRIVVDIFPEKELEFIANAFFQAAERTDHMEEPMRDAARIVSDDVAINFDAEGRPAPWAPLALATIKKRGSAHPILQDSHALVESATSAASWDIAGGGQLVTAELKTPFYGKFHVHGFLGGFKHDRWVPARDWTWLDAATYEMVDKVFADWVLAPIEAMP